MPSIRQFAAFTSFLEAWLAERRSSWTALAVEMNMSEAWMRKIRHGQLRLEHDRADAMGRILGLAGDDLEYWHALVRAASEDWRERAEALGLLAMHRHRPPPDVRSEPTQWLQDQPLGHWVVRALAQCIDWHPDPDLVAQRVRPPISTVQAAQVLDDLEGRGLLDLSGLCIEDQNWPLHRDALRLARHALSAQWPNEARWSMGMTFTLLDDAVDDVAKELGRLSAHLGALREAPGPTEVLLANVVLVPASLPFAVDPDRSDWTRPDTPSAPLDVASDNPLGVAWQDLVRQRLLETGRSQRDLAHAIDRHITWVSRLLGHRLDIHATRDLPALLDGLLGFLEFDADRSTEFRALIMASHPSPRIREEARSYLAAWGQRPEAVERSLLESAEQHRWYDSVVRALTLHGARRPEPAGLASQIVPPVTLQEAIGALHRARDVDAALLVTPAAAPGSTPWRALRQRHVDWFDAIERTLASPQRAHASAWTTLVPLSVDAAAEARRVSNQMLTRLFSYATPAHAGSATVRHLRVSLLRVAV